jgi:hypothetical protein
MVDISLKDVSAKSPECSENDEAPTPWSIGALTAPSQNESQIVEWEVTVDQ